MEYSGPAAIAEVELTYLTMRDKLWNTGHHSNHQLDMNSSLLLPPPPRNAQRIMGRTPAANHSLLQLNSPSVVNSPLDKRLMSLYHTIFLCLYPRYLHLLPQPLHPVMTISGWLLERT
ncbi:hypothetical protein Pcinc_008276 [Petrolisthes cinctipes]|uniref:Uncharacterized protein n=1 Tax=Petrolisthes cinctipes TaxID=88211 RepID=A0AAE1G975_PETCI|nr:hypothetical protein Pcinc_008276 [Petrolisthes cinctipes]